MVTTAGSCEIDDVYDKQLLFPVVFKARDHHSQVIRQVASEAQFDQQCQFIIARSKQQYT
jgi:hypothetical protein